MRKRFQTAVDGPVGVGKSTVSRIVANKTGFLYIDTGAMYRAVALYALRNAAQPALDDEIGVASILADFHMAFVQTEQSPRVLLNGTDVTSDIRSPEVSMGASAVAKHRTVRQFLLARQREMAMNASVVMDGRDIGTRVLPNANLKIYLDAPAETRAARRFAELRQSGAAAVYEDVLAELIRRDDNDRNRAEDPLCVAEGAVVLDVTDITADKAADMIIALIRDRGGL